MEKKLGAPLKIILFAGIHAHGALKLMHGVQGIAEFFVKLPLQPVHIRGVLAPGQFLCMLASHGVLAIALQRTGFAVTRAASARSASPAKH